MVTITDNDFSVDEIIGGMDSPKIGAIVAYVGVVRGFSERRDVVGLEFEADQTAIAKIRELGEKALEDFDVEDVTIVHRVGKLKVGDKLLLVTVSSSHRQSAFDACMSIIDAVKEVHSAWGREYYLS
jgi:molybdopterin synthase catalytic subunit